MRSFFNRALFLFLAILFSVQVFAATLYCDYTNGNDANNCTNGTTQLCKTLQRCVNVATGGDTINVANTSAQVLAAAITWNTGWTADNTKYTIIQAWDNGGSLTIQRPDEATARDAGVISGNGTISEATGSATVPEKIVFKNIYFKDFTSRWIQYHGKYWGFYGCEFTNTATLTVGIQGSSDSLDFANNYLHAATISFQVIASSNYSKFRNNWFDVTSGASRGVVDIGNLSEIIENNIFIVAGSGTYGIRVVGGYNPTISGNTFIGGSVANNAAIFYSGSPLSVENFNNIFWDFDGSGAKPISGTGSTEILRGHNAFYSCNAADTPTIAIGINLTANDVSTTGDPFVDSASDDYTLDPTTGAAAIGSGLGNYNSSVDIGAVQSASGGGGGSSEHAYTWVN